MQSALREGGLPETEVAPAERLISTAVLGFAASEPAGRFRRATIPSSTPTLPNSSAGFACPSQYRTQQGTTQMPDHIRPRRNSTRR